MSMTRDVLTLIAQIPEEHLTIIKGFVNGASGMFHGLSAEIFINPMKSISYGGT